MEYSEFIGLVQQAGGGLGTETAERATEATLRTLAERLSPGEARRLALELPAQLMPWLHTESEALALSIDEFLDRVANREGTDVNTALRHARGVFFALGRALSPESVAHLAALLPQTYAPLVAEAQHRDLDIMPASEFWDRVARRLGGAARDTARRITDAVLETLAERIAAGQVEDLIAQLDPVLHPPLRRGLGGSDADARRMPALEFLRRVAAREGADAGQVSLADEVSGHVRAVFATLAEAVSNQEWFDVIVELPADYQSLIPARPARGCRRPILRMRRSRRPAAGRGPAHGSRQNSLPSGSASTTQPAPGGWPPITRAPRPASRASSSCWPWPGGSKSRWTRFLTCLDSGTVVKYSRGVPADAGRTTYSTCPGVASRCSAVPPVTAAQNRACARASVQSKVML